MKKGVFISVRTTSTRLPNKALMKIGNLSTIEHLIKRVKKSTKADQVVLCTSDQPEDNTLSELAKKWEIGCFRGSLKDKLDRWYKAALAFDVDYFVNVDGDDIFCDPYLIDLAFDQFEREGHDFVKCDEENLVVGAFTFGATRDTLEKICDMKDTDDTEAAWLSFSELDLFDTRILSNVPKKLQRPDIRATLDYQEDFEFFKTVIEHFENNNIEEYSLGDIVEYLDSNPDIIESNRQCQAAYLQNQKKLTKLVLKEEG